MTAALEGGEWSAARPGCTLPPGKTRYPFYRRLCGPQSPSGWAENLVPTGIQSQTDVYWHWSGKFHPITGHKGPEGLYSSTVSLTSALEGVGGQCHASSGLPLGMTWYPLYRRLGGPQGWSWQVQYISPSWGFNLWTIQPVVSCCTNYAIPAHDIGEG